MVECIEMRWIKHDVLKGIAKVKVPELGIILSDVKLFKKNENYWASLPTKEYEKDGKKNYYQFIQFIDKEKGEKILKEITACFIKEIEIGEQINHENRTNREPAWEF